MLGLPPLPDGHGSPPHSAILPACKRGPSDMIIVLRNKGIQQIYGFKFEGRVILFPEAEFCKYEIIPQHSSRSTICAHFCTAPNLSVSQTIDNLVLSPKSQPAFGIAKFEIASKRYSLVTFLLHLTNVFIPTKPFFLQAGYSTARSFCSIFSRLFCQE